MAWLYVHPDDYKPDGNRMAQEAYVRVPGKHRTKKPPGTLRIPVMADRHSI